MIALYLKIRPIKNLDTLTKFRSIICKDLQYNLLNIILIYFEEFVNIFLNFVKF